MNATAFQPRATIGLPREEEWDRLPWLKEEPRRAKRNLHSGWLVGLVLLIAADAVAAYWAGEASARQERMRPCSPERSGEAVPLSRDDAQAVAERISEAQRVGLEWRRPNAPY
jgi:hypothetical protein